MKAPSAATASLVLPGKVQPRHLDRLRPLRDRQVSDSMLETALGWGNGAV